MSTALDFKVLGCRRSNSQYKEDCLQSRCAPMRGGVATFLGEGGLAPISAQRLANG